MIAVDLLPLVRRIFPWSEACGAPADPPWTLLFTAVRVHGWYRAEIEPDRLRLAADDETIADGVTILHTPGHTPGHLSVVVHTDTGLEIIVGQACYTCAEYEADTAAPTHMHTPDWHNTGLDSLARIRELRPVRAHFSHDATRYTPS